MTVLLRPSTIYSPSPVGLLSSGCQGLNSPDYAGSKNPRLDSPTHIVSYVWPWNATIMPSNQDQGRESTHRRHSGAPSFPREGRDLNNQVSATREALPRSQPIPPLPEHVASPRYQGNPNLPVLAPNEQYPRSMATHPGNYYTLEQSPFQPQSAHANISHPGHIPPYSSSHGIGSGRGSYFGSPPHPQGTMHAPSNTTSGPSPSYTRGTTGYTSDANTMSNGQFSHRYIGPPITSGPTVQPLNIRYEIQNRRFFKVGRVFAVVWHEGMGNTAPFNGHTRSVATRSVASDREWVNIGIDRSRFDTPIYTDIRRMVVFKEQAQCAWCFPVHTYGRQGVAKESVDPTKHAVIYMEGGQPQYGRNEPRMTKEPIEVTPSENEKLHAMSRLNFGKIYTVEHHQRVLPVGKISENSLAKFLSYARRETEVGY